MRQEGFAVDLVEHQQASGRKQQDRTPDPLIKSQMGDNEYNVEFIGTFGIKCLIYTTDLRQRWCIDTEFRKCLIFYETLVS